MTFIRDRSSEAAGIPKICQRRRRNRMDIPCTAAAALQGLLHLEQEGTEKFICIWYKEILGWQAWFRV